MKLAEIRELMEAFDGMNICRLELEDGAFSLVLSKEHTPAQPGHPRAEEHRGPASMPEQAPVFPAERAPEPAAEQPVSSGVPEGEAVTAPVVGVFYSAAAPGSEPFVKPGDQVRKGQTLCIVEAMKMMNEITAEFDGVVTEIVPQDGDLVEYGAPLVYLKRV